MMMRICSCRYMLLPFFKNHSSICVLLDRHIDSLAPLLLAEAFLLQARQPLMPYARHKSYVIVIISTRIKR